MSERGKYIVIEGNDGTGKSTQVEKIRERLAEKGIESVEFHEPAGTPIADEIRTIIKNGALERDGETNLLLFTAARREIWHRAKQELTLGRWVVTARNYYSTLAYQGYGEGLDTDLILNTTRIFTDRDYMKPDLAVVLALDDQTRETRITGRGAIDNPDTFESRSDGFQERVNNGYLEIAWENDLKIIDAGKSIDEVTDAIWDEVVPLLKQDGEHTQR
jgi:dTMP kinase